MDENILGLGPVEEPEPVVVCPAERRTDVEDSDRDSTKSLTMKSLLLKVSRLKTGVLREDCKVAVLETSDAVSELRPDIMFRSATQTQSLG